MFMVPHILVSVSPNGTVRVTSKFLTTGATLPSSLPNSGWMAKTTNPNADMTAAILSAKDQVDRVEKFFMENPKTSPESFGTQSRRQPPPGAATQLPG